ncbi:hypothetical protein QJS10_CPB14g00257 [Acorus calamus]|uniref:Uncharacterized protein n=1 Tax=Acorus calamus TaxID=4465 RepID=A0AAV9DDT1_ACOCL|nr:hypothetical protein QJS10_CPB14g00257 [Acorus calamus]
MDYRYYFVSMFSNGDKNQRRRPHLSNFGSTGSTDFFAGGAMSGIVSTPYYVAPEK